ncbi:MAG: GNAT family N-acetyltransferase [Phycisphaerales bacterium]|nr:GNAT family N-acetyltransferase [Phycisphaerales bacterium]
MSATSKPAPPTSLTVRDASLTDIAPLTFFFDTVLRNDYFLRRGQMEDMIRDRSHRVLIAEFDHVLVGVAVLTAGSRLVNALVHPAYRALGVGRAIVEASGADEVRAKIDMSTGDPRPFYRRLGFRATGRRNAKGNIELMRKPNHRTAAKRSTRAGSTIPPIKKGDA